MEKLEKFAYRTAHTISVIAAALLGGWAGLRLYLHIRAAQRRAAGCAHDGLAAGRWRLQPHGPRMHRTASRSLHANAARSSVSPREAR